MPRCRADQGGPGRWEATPGQAYRRSWRILVGEEPWRWWCSRRGSILYLLPTSAQTAFHGSQSPPREGQEDNLAAKVLGDEEAQELHRRARRKRALRRRALERRRRNL